ncbi:M48 family metallopeptidase [Undibacterium sp. CY18W]|uniref:M48 family metallopeptidase n=2 Tax=Undibacterium hunanense TaxID=2762292 RepID=A0ABR6ZSH3_9BURK|nr:M48 family metallopeptidase [Undibacterium hunanense]
MALQLDLFSDFLVPDKLRPAPASPPTPAKDSVQKDEVRPLAPPPSTFVNTSNKRRILIQDYLLEYDLQRSKRRSIGFLINEDGLRITAPRWVTIADIETAIHEKQSWILRKLTERRDRTQRQLEPKMHWKDGAKLPYLGGEITLQIAPASVSGTHFLADQGTLIINLPANAGEQQLKDRVQAWLQQEAKRVFNERLPVFAEKLNVRYQSMALSAATTRWGSCTSQGKIRLNWRLIHFSPMIIDYVVAHELAHLREMNHSPRFWATVQSVFPDFELARNKLRQHASADLPAF